MSEENTQQQDVQETTPPENNEIEPTEETTPPSETDKSTEEEEEEEKPEDKEDKEDKEPPKGEDGVKDILAQNNLDYSALEQEYIDNNGFTEETLEKLHKAGFSDEFINDFVEGKKAIAEKELNELADVIGGRETYDKVIQWSANNLTPDVIMSINAVRDKNIIKLLLPTLKERMEIKEGKAPQTIIQGKGAAVPETIFESKQQMMEAIRDKRYLQDPAYAAKVTAKIRASREAGIDLGI